MNWQFRTNGIKSLPKGIVYLSRCESSYRRRESETETEKDQSGLGERKRASDKADSLSFTIYGKL